MFIPRLIFAKYVSRMDLPFLTDYLERLTGLHPNYQGLVLPGDTRPRPIEEAAKALLALLDNETDARKGFEGFVCRHSVETRASCGNFSWHLTFKRFFIEANLFDDFDDGTGEFTASQAEGWIECAICDDVSVLGSPEFRKIDAWGVYLESKEDHNYDAPSRYSNSPFSYWGEYPEDRRARVAEMLETLRPHVTSYHPELFTGSSHPLDPDTMADCLTFVRYADDRLLRHFGRQRLNALLSVVDISLDQWLAAGEPKPVNYSIGGILLPG